MLTNDFIELLEVLDGFPLTIEGYYQHQAEIMRSVIDRYNTIHGHQVDQSTERLLYALLKEKCRALLEARTEWITIPVEAESGISCRIDGIVFTGTAIIEPKRIVVYLTEGRIQKTCLLYDFAPCIFTKEPFIGSPANQFGQNRAKILFLDTCGKFL